MKPKPFFLPEREALPDSPRMPLVPNTLARLSLACGLLPLLQAVAADHDSSRWEKTIVQFEAADRKLMPQPDGVLFIGSSSIRMWKTLKQDFPGLSVINRGFGGSQIADSIHFAGRIVHPYKPRQIVLYAGDNDVAAGKSPETVLADFQKFVKTVSAKLSKTRISFIAIKPSIRRWKLSGKMAEANALVHDACAKDKWLDYIDIWQPMLGDDGKPRPDLFLGDGLHLNAKGYALWTSIVKPHLVRRE
ncbi:MAG: GDSL-type esterase/lipase family protein [Pedosphaera sp.]|jgi:lysophospholipase L1-like esterase|nr:GDSL-type esterase/lipase family protein [Pedosphaera sp.]|tara:strand:+ start:101 stop:841 length:741 start_codon:yes stop_codon:yes gene_type:complete